MPNQLHIGPRDWPHYLFAIGVWGCFHFFVDVEGKQEYFGKGRHHLPVVSTNFLQQIWELGDKEMMNVDTAMPGSRTSNSFHHRSSDATRLLRCCDVSHSRDISRPGGLRVTQKQWCLLGQGQRPSSIGAHLCFSLKLHLHCVDASELPLPRRVVEELP